MTGFLCSLGGVCLTSLQPIRYCIVTSNFKFASEPSGLQCARAFSGLCSTKELEQMDSGLVCSVLLLIMISVITVVKYCGCSQVSPQQILTTVMMNLLVDKSTDHD